MDIKRALIILRGARTNCKERLHGRPPQLTDAAGLSGVRKLKQMGHYISGLKAGAVMFGKFVKQ